MELLLRRSVPQSSMGSASSAAAAADLVHETLPQQSTTQPQKVASQAPSGMPGMPSSALLSRGRRGAGNSDDGTGNGRRRSREDAVVPPPAPAPSDLFRDVEAHLPWYARPVEVKPPASDSVPTTRSDVPQAKARLLSAGLADDPLTVMRSGVARTRLAHGLPSSESSPPQMPGSRWGPSLPAPPLNLSLPTPLMLATSADTTVAAPVHRSRSRRSSSSERRETRHRHHSRHRSGHRHRSRELSRERSVDRRSGHRRRPRSRS